MSIHDRDMKFMEYLEREAVDTPRCGGARVTALLVIGKDPIAMGWNQKKSNPFAAKFGKHDEAIFFHAETHAIFKALKSIPEEQLRKATLYICRVKYKRVSKKRDVPIWGSSKPCKGCMKCITYYNLKRVVYSLESEDRQFAEMVRK